MKFYPDRLFNTYSIVARDSKTGQLGVAVQTHQMTVGTVVPWLQAGIGAIATQAMSNVSFGPMGLAMLREGLPAPKVVEGLIASDEGASQRQLAVVDSKGQVGAWTGTACIAEAGHHMGEGYSVQANMMTHKSVVPAMSQAYEQAEGDLAERILAALQAAQREGGDIRGMQSAALVVVSGDKDESSHLAIYDLRVDEHENPVDELARLVRLNSAQILDGQGYELFEQGQHQQALEKWAQARAKAPELEELAYWQAVTLADELNDVKTAAAILRPVMANDPRREHWIDLTRRIQVCGIIQRAGAGEELIAALE